MKSNSFKKNKTPIAKVNFWLPIPYLERLRALANSRNVSMAKLIMDFMDNFDKLISYEQRK